MKKIIIQVLLTFLSVLLFAVGGSLFFINYGGNNCGEICDCFCCHMFDLRGYEACGQFGFWAGAAFGLFLAVLLIWWWNNRRLVKIDQDELEDEFIDDPHEEMGE